MSNREKGKRGERYFATLLREIFPDIMRNANGQSQQGGVDLLNTGMFNCEVKTGKVAVIKRVQDWLEQVKGEGRKENLDLVLVKPHRLDAYVVMPFSDFKEILKMLKSENII